MRILYVTTNFETRTHTFITREIAQVRRAGEQVDLLALRRIPPAARSEAPECDLSGCRYVYPVNGLVALGSLMARLVTRPRTTWRVLRSALADQDDGVLIKGKLIYQLAVATTLEKAVRDGRYDLIHAHFASPPTTFAMFLGMLTGIPYTFTGHGADVYRDHSALRPKLRHASGVVCISEYNRRHYVSLEPVQERTVLVHCGIDSAAFPFRTPPGEHDEIAVLGVGRYVAKKGFHVLLEALARLDAATVPWRATIVGDGPEGAALRSQAARLGIADRVAYTGGLPQVRIKEMLAVADIFVLPSIPATDGDIDGIPVSLMEAMAVGCPVVSTEVSGIPELIDDGNEGVLVAPGDATALARAIERLAHDPKLRATLANAARRKIEAAFDLTTETAKLCAFFARVAAASRPASR